MSNLDRLQLTEKERVADTIEESAVLWKSLISKLGVTVSGEGISDEDRTRIEDSYDDEILEILNKTYRNVQGLSSDDEKRAYILKSKPLGFILKVITSERESNNNFVFKQNSEIVPKRFGAILPVWEKLLDSLTLDISDDDCSEVNRAAVSLSNEEESARHLHEMYRQVSVMESPEEQIDFIKSHEPLRLILMRARTVLENLK